MDKRLLGVIGIIAGIIVLVGVFSPWSVASGEVYGTEFSEGESAWDAITQADIYIGGVDTGEQFDFEFSALLALIGAVLILVGALAVLASPDKRMLWSLIFNGGIIAIIGAIWAFADMDTGSESGYGYSISYGYGYGLYLALVGGILGLSGTLGLKSSNY